MTAYLYAVAGSYIAFFAVIALCAIVILADSIMSGRDDEVIELVKSPEQLAFEATCPSEFAEEWTEEQIELWMAWLRAANKTPWGDL